jgi:peptidoglycan/LPS O-acetylase OafA/YrhL
MPPPSRQLQLDSLRAFGLVTVVAVHAFPPGGASAEDIGPLAMSLFFVLSGFLISGLLFDARERAEAAGLNRVGVLGRFYVRRFLRIFPVYYATLFVAFLIGEPTTRQYISELVTYRTNFLLASTGHPLPPITLFWSLAVEEHFYLVWPLVALFAARRTMKWVAIGMVATSLIARGVLSAIHAPYVAVTLPTYSSVDGIAMGCLLAMAWRETTADVRAPWIRRAAFIGLALQLLRMLLFAYPVWNAKAINNTLHTFPFALICVWIVDRGARDRLPALLRNKWLADLGMVSYGAYVMHKYVMHYLGYETARGPEAFVVVLTVSIMLAIVSWLVMERPINDLKRYFPYIKKMPLSKRVSAAEATYTAGTPQVSN